MIHNTHENGDVGGWFLIGFCHVSWRHHAIGALQRRSALKMQLSIMGPPYVRKKEVQIQMKKPRKSTSEASNLGFFIHTETPVIKHCNGKSPL